LKRNPNHYGSVVKLSGNRARPYAALLPISNVGGKPKRQALGYYQTEAEARIALADWNKTRSYKTALTVNDCFEEFIATNKSRLTPKTIATYSSAFKNISEIHNKRIVDLRQRDFQNIIDNSIGMFSRSSINVLVALLKQIESIALGYDVIERNYATGLRLPAIDKKEREALADDQIVKIYSDAVNGNEIAMQLFIMLASGWRISEFSGFTKADYNPQFKTLTGGVKTANGKNRIVPIHSTAQPFFEYFYDRAEYSLFMPVNSLRYYIGQYGLKDSKGNAVTPHATRHTFASLGHRYRLDDICLRRMLGHSYNDITEQVYVHVGPEELKYEIEKIKLAEICHHFVNS